MVDIMLVTKNYTDNSLRINAIYNNVDRTAFFLKVRMISDTTVATAVAGASYRCVLTDLNDHKFVAVSGSPGQSGFHALSSPFSHFGIGRSNNFIEELTIGLYVKGARVTRSWSPVIPKTILFIVANLSPDGAKWHLDLLSKPTDKIPVILLVDGLFLLVLGLVIIVLHLYEKSEDKRENE